METNRAHEIIVSVLQSALVGKLNPMSNFKPQDVADAIATKVEFEKTYNNSKSDTIIGTLIDNIVFRKEQMQNELDKIDTKEIVLRNFIQGKLTAYEEILNVLNNL